MTCTRSPEEVQAARGYEGAEFVTPSFLPAVDWTLRPFDRIAQLTAGAASTVFQPVVRFAVPIGLYGMLDAFGTDADNATAFQTAQWRITVNGIQVGDTIPALVQIAQIDSYRLCPWPCFLPPGALVALEVMSAAVGAEVVRGRLKGTLRSASGRVNRS